MTALAINRHGLPIVYPVLGLTMHLEPFVLDDTPRLEQAVSLLRATMEPHLKWTLLGAFGRVSKFRSRDLEYLEMLADMQAERDHRDLAARWRTAQRAQFGLTCHSGEDPHGAAHHGLEVLTDTAQPGERPIDAMIRLTFPQSTPLDELTRFSDELVQILRIRWATCGFAYSYYAFGDDTAYREAVYAHARRFAGYDWPSSLDCLHACSRRVRSVNWITYLGRDLSQQAAVPNEVAGLAIERSDDLVRIRAGERPCAYDRNRLEQTCYELADKAIRAVRASANDIPNLGNPWTRESTAEWLRRFEEYP